MATEWRRETVEPGEAEAPEEAAGASLPACDTRDARTFPSSFASS
jgi:hypothetical protein